MSAAISKKNVLDMVKKTEDKKGSAYPIVDNTLRKNTPFKWMDLMSRVDPIKTLALVRNKCYIEEDD